MAKLTEAMVRIHDLSTGEVVDREMNDVEFAALKANQTAEAITKAEADANAAAKTAILDRIGLTADELKTILG